MTNSMTIECQVGTVFWMEEEDPPEEMASKQRQHGNAANHQAGNKLVNRQGEMQMQRPRGMSGLDPQIQRGLQR